MLLPWISQVTDRSPSINFEAGRVERQLEFGGEPLMVVGLIVGGFAAVVIGITAAKFAYNSGCLAA
jgi:hypothetical protein